MQFPRSLTNGFLKKSIVPGAVICFRVDFPDGGNAVKRLIVVSHDKDSVVLMLTTTSNLFLNKSYRKDDIYLKAKEEASFEKETLVQMNRVIEKPIAKLQEIYAKGEMTILKPVTRQLLDRIYSIIEKSDLIEQKYIKQIIQGRMK